MARFNLYKLSPQEQRRLLDRFFIAATSLDSFEEIKNFFKDLLHPQEIAMLARRLKIAEMLLSKETYDEISRRMGVGYTTIAKVHRWVNAKRGGYRIVVERLKKFDNRQLRRDLKENKALKPGWERVKKIYPTLDLDSADELIGVVEDYIRRKKRKKSLKKSVGK
jgi:TrpR-related protein YerC/YecD